MSSRVKTEENIVRIREAVAPQITIDWNPVNNDGSVTFFLKDMVTEDDVYKGLQDHATLKPKPNTRDMKGTITVPISEIMTSMIRLQGNYYPGIVLMGLIKAYFEQLYTQRLEDQEAREQEALITPTPSASMTPEPTPFASITPTPSEPEPSVTPTNTLEPTPTPSSTLAPPEPTPYPSPDKRA